MKTELEKLIEEYGITSEHIFCGIVSGSHMSEAWESGRERAPGFKKYIFTLKVKDYSDDDTNANHIEPDGPQFFEGYQYRGKRLSEPTTASFIHSYLLDYTEESFEDWCDEFGFSTDSRQALKAYEQCKESGERLRAFINDEDKFQELVLAAQEY